jgi:hypothetical protein
LLGRARGGDHPHSAAAALVLSVQDVEEADPSGMASLVLRVVAVLSPDGVRRDLLNGLRTGTGMVTGDMDVAVERCAAGSLLTWSVAGDAVIMHRLPGRVLRERDRAVGCWQETVDAALNSWRLCGSPRNTHGHNGRKGPSLPSRSRHHGTTTARPGLQS